MCPISSEGVTPPSSLLLAHVPLPLGSPLLRFLASFGESLQVVLSPCCPRELPDVISENLSLDAGSRIPAVPPCARTCFFPGGVGLPQAKVGSASRVCPTQIVPTAAHTPAGQPGLLRPGLSCSLPRSGYASRPNTGN